MFLVMISRLNSFTDEKVPLQLSGDFFRSLDNPMVRAINSTITPAFGLVAMALVAFLYLALRT
jgi:hypothetical protein